MQNIYGDLRIPPVEALTSFPGTRLLRNAVSRVGTLSRRFPDDVTTERLSSEDRFPMSTVGPPIMV